MLAGVLVGDRGLGRTSSALADEHRAGLRNRLYPRGGVDDVACDHALPLGGERDGGLARQNCGTQLQLRRTDLGPERRDGGDEVEGGANGALGVVLLRDRGPQTAMTASPMNFSIVPP